MDGLLASGRTADIYPYGDGFILKLFRTWVSRPAIENEQHKAMIAHRMGIPTPSVGDIVHQDTRIGLVFGRVEGTSMMERLIAEPDSVEAMARLLAELHVSLHRRSPLDRLPSQRDILKERVSGCDLLSESERTAVLDVMADLPSSESFCHGDFHPGNVMLTDREPTIIDWIDASSGSPIADVASTSLLFLAHIENDRAAPAPIPVPAVMLFHQTYLDQYMERNPGRWSEYQQWLPVVAAARLRVGIKWQEDWLLEQVRKGLNNR